MKREDQGATDQIVDSVNGVAITTSNFIGKEPIGKCSHYDRKKLKCTELTRPTSIETYK